MQTDKICNGLGIPAAQRQQDFDSLSGGEKTRVNLARLLLEKTDILLLDEPTNHLDMHAVEWLEGYIEKFKGTVLTISHDRYFLDRVVTRIVELHDGKAEFYSGNYSFYVQEKQARFELQLKQYEKEQAKLAQLGFTLERMKGWGINNRTLYRRAMSIQHRMERIEKTDRPTQDKTMRAKFAQRDFFGDEVLSVKGLGNEASRARAAPGLQNDHRLAAACHTHGRIKGPRVTQSFNMERNDARLGIVGQKVDDFSKFDVALEPRGNDARKTHGRVCGIGKNGTPPRINARSVDFSKMELQPGDDDPVPFPSR